MEKIAQICVGAVPISAAGLVKAGGHFDRLRTGLLGERLKGAGKTVTHLKAAAIFASPFEKGGMITSDLAVVC